LPDEVIDQIIDRTDGEPLFIEELTRSVLESGLLREETDRYVLNGALSPFAIPTTLHDSLMARLDRLSSVRRVAQIGAAIGREFSYPLLRTVSGLAEDELKSALARLVSSELVIQRGTLPDAVYAFKHSLVQDAAHDSLLRGTRQRLHAQIAEALEAGTPEVMDSQPELLARHYTEAGLVEKSVTYWGKAGHMSVARSAMTEAAAQFYKTLDQLALLPDGPERQRKELEFHSALGGALQATKGYAAPETGRAYARAQQLWEQLGSPPEFLRVPVRQSVYHAIRGELDLALRLDEELLRLSRQHNEYAGLVLGHLSAGRELMYMGRLTSSRLHLEEVLALYDPISDHSVIHRTGDDPHVVSLAFLGIVFFCLGYPDQALARSKAAIAAARTLAHPTSLAVSLNAAARLFSLVGDNAALEQRVGELISVATEQGFPHWRGVGTIYRGWLQANDGNVTRGLCLLRSGSAVHRSTGAESLRPYHIALLARAYDIAGQIEEAVTQLDDALQIVEKTGERWFAAELNRHKGQVLLRQGHAEAAEELYSKALSIAQEQEAKLWELRAAISLARLRRDQGRCAEAHDLLAPVYGWFTEGFDTPDLKEAKALLEGLT
jgi:predicted ATPase